MPDEVNTLGSGTGNPGAADNSTGGASGSEENNSTGQGATNLGWRAGLPSDLRDHEAFRDKGTVGDMGRSYLEMQQKLQNSVQIPGENATPDEKKAFARKLGVPESPEEYTINSSDDKEFSDHFKKLAHDSGLSKSQAEAIHAEVLRFSNARSQGLVEAQKEKQKAAETGLKQEWGASYEQKDAAAKRFLLVAGSDFADAMTESGLHNDPRVRKGLYMLSQMISEDRMVSGRGQPANSGGWQFENTPGM